MYKVLFVCTGNICRSPTADGILRHRIMAEGLADRVFSDSAGTDGYHAGNPPDARSIATARARGYDLSSLRARQFTPRDADDFDLILAMDEGHYAALRPMIPHGARAELKLFLDYAPSFGTQSVPDPYFGDQDGFDVVLDMAEQGVHGLLSSLQRVVFAS